MRRQTRVFAGRAVETGGRRNRCPPNAAEVHPRDASGAPRTSGAPVAAMHEVLTLSVCKRRDAVRLGTFKAARPPGAASGVSSGATSKLGSGYMGGPLPRRVCQSATT